MGEGLQEERRKEVDGGMKVYGEGWDGGAGDGVLGSIGHMLYFILYLFGELIVLVVDIEGIYWGKVGKRDDGDGNEDFRIALKS